MIGLLLKPRSVVQPRRMPTRLPERKSMTIAAGVLCSDGIVVCADSEETDYVAKYERQKIRSFENRLLVAGSGHSNYFGMTFNKICDRFKERPSDSSRARFEVEQVVSLVHENHIFKWWKPDDPQRPYLHLVVAARCMNGELALVSSSDTAVRLHDDYVSVGEGKYLFEYWAKLFFATPRTTREASYISLFLLREVKDNVAGCGGTSHVVTLPMDSNQYTPGKVFNEDLIWAGFPATAVDALLASIAPDVQDSVAEQVITRFADAVRGMRQAIQQKRSVEEALRHYDLDTGNTKEPI